MDILFALWVLLASALAVIVIWQRGKGGALVLTYFLGLSIIHIPGILPYLVKSWGISFRGQSELGFELTLAGMAAFVGGVLLASSTTRVEFRNLVALPNGQRRLGALGLSLVGAGFVAIFVLIPLSFLIPSASSIVSSLGNLLIVGMWVILFDAVSRNDNSRVMLILLSLPVLPLATLTVQGLVSSGTNWAISAIALLFVIARRHAPFFLATPIVLFLGLSLFVTYMGHRHYIRELVWENRSNISDRLDRISGIVTDFQLLDLSDPAHTKQLVGRLDQNWIVGAAVQHHDQGYVDFAYGGTIAPWALIPRALWSDKPVVGGGRDLVSKYTGYRFGNDTSVGAGQVLEFYVNFGIPGVILGFVALGYLLMRLDFEIMRALSTGNVKNLLLYAMPGLTLLQPGGNLLEIVVGVAAAILIAYILGRLNIFRIGRLEPSALAMTDIELKSAARQSS